LLCIIKHIPFRLKAEATGTGLSRLKAEATGTGLARLQAAVHAGYAPRHHRLAGAGRTATGTGLARLKAEATGQ
jgi:hypothetical protein